MRKATDVPVETAPAAEVARRGRVLARVLAEDLREVWGGSQFPVILAGTRTVPPPGYDVTFSGSDDF